MKIPLVLQSEGRRVISWRGVAQSWLMIAFIGLIGAGAMSLLLGFHSPLTYGWVGVGMPMCLLGCGIWSGLGTPLDQLTPR